MTENRLEGFFLNEKPVKLMVKLHDRSTENYASALSTEIDSTYSHTVKTLQKMEDFGLLRFSQDGRKKVAKLTEEGESIAGILVELVNRLDK